MTHPPLVRTGRRLHPRWRTRAGVGLVTLVGLAACPSRVKAASTWAEDGVPAASDTLRVRFEAAAEYRRGVAAFAAGDPRTAVDAFERALALGYRPPAEAHLQLGRARRELPLHAFRAVRSFRAALREQPESLEALYGLADVWLHLDGWDAQREARRALTSILELEPSHRDAYERWRALYPDEDEIRRVADGFEERLRDGFDERLASRVVALRLDIGDGAGAERLLATWAAAIDEPSAAWYHASARLAFSRGHAAEATRRWEQGLDAAVSADDLTPWWEEVAPLLDPDVVGAERGGAHGDQAAFLRGFWEARDPLPFSEANERLAEQARRATEARRRYLWKKPYAKEKLLGETVDDLGRPSFDTRLDGRSLDDRGTLYLRHGEPDRVFVDVGGAEYWRYRRPWAPGGRLQFHFKLMDGPMAAGNDVVYSILPTTDVGESNVRRGHAGSEGVEQTILGLTTDTWSFDYGERVFPLATAAATFRSAADRWRTDVLLAVALPLDSLRTLGAGVDDMLVRRVKLYDARHGVVQTREDTLALPPAARGALVEALEVSVEPGERPWVVQVDAPRSGALGLARGRLDVPSYGERRLQLSDVLLASSVRPAAEDPGAPERGGLALRPLLATVVERDRALHLYYEVYDPQPNADGRLSYRVAYRVEAAAPVRRGLLKRIFGAGDETADGRGVSVVFERERPRAAERLSEAISLDLSELPPGRYRLSVTVEDLVAKARIERTTDLELRGIAP